MTGNIVPLRDATMLNAALQYLKIGAAVLPLWWIEDTGSCACRKAICDSPGKHPIGRLVIRGVTDASKDEAKVKQWWAAYPRANIGVATGRTSSIVVVDVDGPKGEAKLNTLLAEQQVTLEAKSCVNTGRADGGRHFYFAYPSTTNVPSHKDDGLEIKSDGSYVVAPPSRHATGRIYEWVNLAPRLDECPKCIIDFAIRKRRLAVAGEPGRFVADKSRSRVIDRISSHAPPAWSEAEEKRIRLALEFVPADDRENWLSAGMALHWTGWDDRARAIWDDWSRKSDKFDSREQDKAWESFARPRGEGPPVTLGTLYHMAKQHGFTERLPDEIEELNGRYFVVKIGGKSLIGEFATPLGDVRRMLSFISVDAFNTWHANRKIAVRDHKGNERQMPLAKAWLEHPKRRQYEGLELDPSGPAELPSGCLNLWRGFGVEPKKGEWSLLAWHVREVLANGDPKAAEYIFRWMAWSLQHPGELAEAALVLRGGREVAKGCLQTRS